MKRKLSFLMLFMALCSFAIGQTIPDWGENHAGEYELSMAYALVVHIDDVYQATDLLEVAPYYDDKRVGEPVKLLKAPDQLGGKYVADGIISAETGAQIKFKMYNYATGEFFGFSDNHITFVAEEIGNILNPSILKYTSVAEVDNLIKYGNFQNAVNAAADGETVKLNKDVVGDVLITQTANVSITIDGNNKSFTGIMKVFGNGNQNGEETLTIKNINFIAKEGADACIVSPEKNTIVYNSFSYSHNVTVIDCTFTDPDGTVNCAAIRHEDGGDKNWTVKNCTVANTMHSLLQVNNVINKLVVDGCIVNSKNGVNLNSCTNVVFTNNDFNVQGYALRSGVASGGNLGETKTYVLNNNKLKSACNDGDAVIMFRASSVDAKFTMDKNVIKGDRHISGNTADTKFNADANYWDGENTPRSTTPIVVTTYYLDEALTQLARNAMGNTIIGYTSAQGIWSETWGNAVESYVVKALDADGNVMGTTSLNNIGGIIDGDVTVTWNLKLDAASNTDNYWAMSWTTAPTIDNMPKKVQLWIDGVNVSEGPVVLNGPDGQNPIFAAKTDADGKIISYIACDGFNLNNANDVLQHSIADGDNIAILVAGTYKVPTGKDVTITGAVDGVVFDNIGECGMAGADVTFNNVTFDYYPNVNYTGLQHSGNLVYNNCTINGQVFLYGEKETFNNCKFNQNSSDAYNVWTYGAKEVVFNECTFNSAGKSVLIYAEGESIFNDVTVTGCTFNATASVEGKAAIEMDSSLTSGIELTITNTTAEGFGTGNISGNSLWNNKKGNEGDNNDITVIVDGVTVLAPEYEAQIGDVKYQHLTDAIAAAQAGDVVKVFAGTYPLPSMKAGITIEGAVDENGEVKVLFEGTLTGTLEDLTLKNIHIRGGNAQRWAYAKGDLTFVNVIFEATSVYALHFDGITEGTNLLYEDCTIIGWAAMGGTPESCKFIRCTIKDNGTYGVIRTYFDTTIEECTFDVDGANPNDNFQDGIHAVDGAYVIVNGCTNVNGTMEDIVNIHAMSVVSIDGVEIKHLAKIGDNYYFTLAEAFTAAQDGETVQLLADLTLDSETYTIADGKSVTLDMNGKKITVTDNKTINYELFYIYGGLTVIGDGTIELTATNDRDWNAMSAIFHNRGGVLTINNGTFKHLGGTDMAYVVDNSGNYYGDATTNINNGTLASTYIAIRNRMEQNTHGASGKAILNVANGSISGTSRAIWAQAASTSDTAPATGEINISGGTIGLIDTPCNTGAVSMTTISGGTVSAFQGEVNELKVTGGTLNDVTIMDASGNEIDYAVNKDGLYVAAVAKIGDKGYVSIQAAVNEAQDGNTVIVKEGKYNVFCPVDSDDNYTGRAHNLFVGKSITIKGEEGKEVVIYSYQETYTSTFDARITLLISGSDGVVIDNLTILPCYYPATITTDLSTVTGSEINALVGADNLKYYYNQIIDAMSSYNNSGQVSKDYIANITVKNCTIGDEAIPAENWGSAIYYPGAVGNATNFAGLTGGYTIENNVLFGGICICEGAAKDATTETCIIKNNTIHGGLFLNGKRPTGWNYVSLTVFPTVTGNTFTQAAGNTDGHAWFIGSRDGDEAAVIPTGTLEAYLANNTFTVASDKKAKVVVGNYAYSAEATEYYGLVSSEFIVDGEGTENNPYIITDLHELEAFRDAVNAGNDFSGKVFKLKSNIDLNPTRAINYWEPIGTQANPFEGTFDGGDNTISNLLVVGEKNVGLFGYADNATIKNVKLENVNVKGTDCVGAIAGQVFSTSLIDSCHVSGSIKVEGQTNVGGIVGKYYTKVKNCSVIGDGVATSYVKGTYVASDLEGDNIAGIMGHGGENNTFTNNTVKNITISGTRKVGGIVGVTDQNTDVTNCVVENVNIVTTATAEYAEANKTKAGHAPIVGSYTSADANNNGTVIGCTVKNVTFVNDNNVTASFGPITGGARGGTNGMLAPSTDIVSEGNLIYMSTITGTTTNMYLMNPVAMIGTTEYYTLFDAVAAVQDGETKTITMLRNTAEEFAIDNTTANITLDMAGDTLTGAITPSKANLTIKNGTIKNENASYSAIEINAGTLVLNDVKVTSKRHGVRIDGAVTATINGGEYTLNATSGTRHAVNVSGAANVTITDGIFVGPKGTTMDSGSAVCVQAGAKVTIEGGDFSGGKNATLGVSGTMTVTGGTFDQDVTAYCAQGYLCELNTTTNKYEVFRGLTGEGTEANPYLIKNLSDLVFFRDHVNAGETRYNAPGVWVALANNIDMTDIANWTPIGNVDYNNKYIPQGPVFVGVFNGNGKVISNLKVASTVGGVDTQANVGLFGITGEGAVIKNLTLTNVTINTDGRNVGALAGFAYKATLENITVNGDIQIKGGNNVSGVAGMTRFYAMSATDIAVKGNDGSVIEGNNIIGGITAEIAPNGSTQTFKDLSVENVAIKGVSGVGGIVGLLTLGTVENVSVKDVALTGKTEYQGDAMGRIRLGSVAGLMGNNYATIINPTVENVTAKNLDGNDVVLPIIGANYDASSNATEARIGDTYYKTLKLAIEAAQANNTITLLANVELAETATIEKAITLDLNGMNVTVADDAIVFNVKATMTLDGTITGNINLATAESVLIGAQTLNVTTDLSGYIVVYENGQYKLTQGQRVQLANGWNWYSSYINDDVNALETLQAALDTNGIQIKDDVQYTNYYGNKGWYGRLTTIAPNEKMYMIKTSADTEIEIRGEKVDPNTITITIKPGWNYIPYPLDVAQSITTALGFTPQENDIIKGKGSTAVYVVGTNGQGWLDEFNMEPGQGYMYKSNATATITFKYSYPTGGAKSSMLANVETIDYHWTVDAHKYANSMNMIAMVNVDGEMVKGGYEVAAFSNEGECRGTARPFYVEDMDAYLMILTIHGEEVENLTFRYYDIDTDTEYELNNVVTYSDNAIVGTIDNPYIFTMNILGIGENSIDNINIYPNPTTTDREINLNATFDKVEVYNALGVKVVEYQNVDTIDALETAGIYVIRVTDNNGDVKHCRLVVK